MKKMLILTLALSVIVHVASFAQDMSKDDGMSKTARRTVEEPQGDCQS